MKSCPICHAVAFDDALLCYGCPHRFEEAPPGGARADGGRLEEPAGGGEAAAAAQEKGLSRGAVMEVSGVVPASGAPTVPDTNAATGMPAPGVEPAPGADAPLGAGSAPSAALTAEAASGMAGVAGLSAPGSVAHAPSARLGRAPAALAAPPRAVRSGCASSCSALDDWVVRIEVRAARPDRLAAETPGSPGAAGLAGVAASGGGGGERRAASVAAGLPDSGPWAVAVGGVAVSVSAAPSAEGAALSRRGRARPVRARMRRRRAACAPALCPPLSRG